MTVSVEDTKEVFVGDGETVSWPFDFKVNGPEDLHVLTISVDGTESSLMLSTDYTVTLNVNQNTNPGGVVTTTSPIPPGVPGVIMRRLSFTRIDEFTTSVPPHIIEEELDRLTMYALELRERLDRSLHVSAATQEFADVNLRNVPARRNKLIGFDDSPRANAVLLALQGDSVTGPPGVTRVCRVEVDEPAVFHQANNGEWSHTACVVTFIWTANGTVEQTRSIEITIDEANDRFNVPTPVTGITVDQDAGLLLTKLTSTFEGVTDYIQLAVIRMASPVSDSDTFTPTWGSGEFTTPPSGTVACTKAAGLVTMSVSGARVAESDSNAMTWQAGSVPEDFRPASARSVQCKLRYSDSIVTMGVVSVNPDGGVVFSRFNGVTSNYEPTGWQVGEDKGLPTDWCIAYPL